MSDGVYFIDTSALFKRYVFESGTDRISELFENARLLIISSLTIVEIMSNARRMLDVEKSIDIGIYTAIKRDLFDDIENGMITVEPVLARRVVTSVDLIDKNYITPIDSLQLSELIALKAEYENIAFVCSDKKLCGLAEQKGIKVLRIE